MTRPEGTIKSGSPHDLANQLGVNPKHVRYILRLLTPDHQKCHRVGGSLGKPVPQWGKLNPEQVAKVTNYIFADNETRKRIREGRLP